MTHLERKKHLESTHFTWGKIKEIHEIGFYLIVEYHSINFDGVAPVTPREYESKPSFYPYVNGDDCRQSFKSLDESLAHAIAVKNDGFSTRADEYFIKSITNK